MAAACALALAGVASAHALVAHPSRAAAPRATCSQAVKATRSQALAAFKRSMAPKRKRYLRTHPSRKARARFVRAQQQTLARLTGAARCVVTSPLTTTTDAGTAPGTPTTQPGQPPSTTTRAGTTTTRSTTTTTTTTAPPPPPTTTTPASSPGPATATVVKQGFTEAATGGLAEADYGVVLANTSSDHDAKAVQVTVSALDSGGKTLSSDTTMLFAIPAGTTYAFGGEIIRPSGVSTAAIAVSVSIGQSVAKAAVPPPIANVRVEPSPTGGVEIVGEVANPAAAPLNTLARVTAVVFNSAGNPIGGNMSFPQADLPHGARIGFSAHIAAVAPGAVASAQVSIEPRYNAVLPTGPPVAVQKSGFSEAATGATREADYGVVLHNTSATLDAVDVEVIVDAVDASNAVVGTDGRLVLAIPAGATYYFGGSIVHSAARPAASLEVYFMTAVGAPAALAPPGTANVHVAQLGTGTQITGELVNNATRPLSSLARITGVVFDGAGNVIGGGAVYQPSAVAPGAHAPFTIKAPSVPFGAAASAQVSAEPEYN